MGSDGGLGGVPSLVLELLVMIVPRDLTSKVTISKTKEEEKM